MGEVKALAKGRGPESGFLKLVICLLPPPYLPLSASFLSGDVTLETFSGSISFPLKPQRIPFPVVSYNAFFFFGSVAPVSWDL